MKKQILRSCSLLLFCIFFANLTILASMESSVHHAKRKSVADIQKFQKDADEYIKSRDYINAIKSSVKVLRIDKYDPLAQYTLGYLYENHVKDSLEEALRLVLCCKSQLFL